jgi:hypothetical protein
MLLRADTPSLICEADRRLRGSTVGNGANVMRGVDGLFVFTVTSNDDVDWDCEVDSVNSDSSEDDCLGICIVNATGSGLVDITETNIRCVVKRMV